MRRLLLLALLLPAAALGAETGARLDHARIDPNDLVSLQSGARTFVNYCLGCHGAQYLRYNRLADIGLSEAQIREHLLFTGEKVGDVMRSPLGVKEGKEWFGVAPPDLSVVGRSRSPDWLYTYLRTFHRDAATATGWNNHVFPNAAMPHALWKLQADSTPVQYDAAVRDLVNFLVWVGEPAAQSRKRIGILVLFALGIVFIFTYLLKKEYWKDVK